MLMILNHMYLVLKNLKRNGYIFISATDLDSIAAKIFKERWIAANEIPYYPLI